jgi:hypothetical protein
MMSTHDLIDAEERETTNGNGSRFNALKHGLTATTLVLPGEDPAALQAKIDLYKEGAGTTNEVEEEMAERAAVAAWRHDRAIRDEIAQLNRDNLAKAAADQLKRKLETEALGQRLLFDRRGPIELYPSRDHDRQHDRTSWIDDPNDPDHPRKLVGAMEATLSGCQWLAASWRELRDRLDEGLSLQSHEKFKMIRLMARQPINAVSVRDVARVFLACHALEPQFSYAFQELRCEIHEDQFKTHKRKLERWNKAGITPENPTAAREELLAIIDKAIERLRMLEAEHQADQLSRTENRVVGHDDAKARGQLDRHLEICDRAIHRNLQGIKKLRRNEAEGWGRTRQDRERRREEERRGGPVDDRLIIDEHGTVRPADRYAGNLEEGLARYKAMCERGDRNMAEESLRKEICAVDVIPDFARWKAPAEDLGVSGRLSVGGGGQLSPVSSQLLEGGTGEEFDAETAVLASRAPGEIVVEPELGQSERAVEIRNAGRQEGAGTELVALTQVLTETGGQSNGQNEIFGGQLSVVSGQLLEGGTVGRRDGGDCSRGLEPDRTETGAERTEQSRRLLKWEIKQRRKEMARSELERRRGGTQLPTDKVPLKDVIGDVGWPMPNSVKVRRDLRPRST